MLLRPKGVILRQDFTVRQSQGPFQFYAIMKTSGPFLQQTMLRCTYIFISFCFLLFNNILFLFLCTFSVCFQLLQSLLKLVPTTFSLSFLQVRDVPCQGVTMVVMLRCVPPWMPCSAVGRARNPALPGAIAHPHVGVGGSLRDGFFQLVRFPGENSEN